MDIFNLKTSITEMTDEELQGIIQQSRQERRTATRVSKSKPKAEKAPKVSKPMDYSKMDPTQLAMLSDLFSDLMGDTEDGK